MDALSPAPATLDDVVAADPAEDDPQLLLHCAGGRLHRWHRLTAPAAAVQDAVGGLPLLTELVDAVVDVEGHRVPIGAVSVALRALPDHRRSATLITTAALELVVTAYVDEVTPDRFLVTAHAAWEDIDAWSKVACLAAQVPAALATVTRRAMAPIPEPVRAGRRVQSTSMRAEELAEVLAVIGLP